MAKYRQKPNTNDATKAALQTVSKALSAVQKTGSARQVARAARRATKAATTIEGGRQLQRQKTIRSVAAQTSANIAAGLASMASDRSRNSSERAARQAGLNSLLKDMYGNTGESQDQSTTSLNPTVTGEQVGRRP